MKKPCALWNIMLVFFLWGITLSPPEVRASTHSFPESKPDLGDTGSKREGSFVQNQRIEETDGPGNVQDGVAEGVTDPFVEARNNRGYVDMDSEEGGDRFVDEDGDGIDDRRMMRHRNRNRKQWNQGHQRETVGKNGEKGNGGHQRQQGGAGMGGR